MPFALAIFQFHFSIGLLFLCKSLECALILYFGSMSFPLLPLLAGEELTTNHNNYYDHANSLWDRNIQASS